MIQAAAMHGTAMLTANLNVSPAGGTPQAGEAQGTEVNAFASTLIGSISARGKDLPIGDMGKSSVPVSKSALRTLADAVVAGGALSSANTKETVALPQSKAVMSSVKDAVQTAIPSSEVDSTVQDAPPLELMSVVASQPAGAGLPVALSMAKSGPIESASITGGKIGKAVEPSLSSSATASVGVQVDSTVAIPAGALIANSAIPMPLAQTLPAGQNGEAQSLVDLGVDLGADLGAGSRATTRGASTVAETKIEVQGGYPAGPQSILPAGSPGVSSAILPEANTGLTMATQQVSAAPLLAGAVPLVSAGSSIVATTITRPNGLTKPVHGVAAVSQRDLAAAGSPAQSAVAVPSATATVSSVPPGATDTGAPSASINTSPLVAELSVPSLPLPSPATAPIAAVVSTIATNAPASLSEGALSTVRPGAVSVRQAAKKEAATRPVPSVSNGSGPADFAESASVAVVAASAVRTTAPMNAPLPAAGSVPAAAPVPASVATVASIVPSPRPGASPTVPAAVNASSRTSGAVSPIISTVDESAAPAVGAVNSRTATAQVSPTLNVVQPINVGGQSASNTVTPAGPASATTSVNGAGAPHNAPLAAAGVAHPAAAVSTAAAITVPQAVDTATPPQHAPAIAVTAAGPVVHVAPIAFIPSATPTVIAPSGSTVSSLAVSANPVSAFASASDHQTLVSTPNVLEVGVSSGTEGWLRIRAELQPQSGEITASVVANSATAVDSLHRQLPAMTAYLAGEQVNVSSVVIERSGAAHDAGGAGAGNLLGQSGQQNAGSRQNEGGASYGSDPITVAAPDTWSGAQTGDAATAVDNLPLTAYAVGNGSWLNVQA